MTRKKTTGKSLNSEPTVYPLGSFVKTELGYFFILTSVKRLRLTTKRAVESWSPHRIILTTEAACKNYRITAKMKFRNGSLLHSYADGKIYLIEEGKRRHITSPDALERVGGTMKDAISVSQDELKLHETGEELK